MVGLEQALQALAAAWELLVLVVASELLVWVDLVVEVHQVGVVA